MSQSDRCILYKTAPLLSLLAKLGKLNNRLKIEIIMKNFKKLLVFVLIALNAPPAHCMSRIMPKMARLLAASSAFAVKASSVFAAKENNQPEKPVLSGKSYTPILGSLFPQKSPEPQIPQYTINFMWINKKLDEKQTDIFPKKDRCGNDIQESHIQNIIDWAELNPQATVHLYPNSTLTFVEQ